jgi:hypothetical protein
MDKRDSYSKEQQQKVEPRQRREQQSEEKLPGFGDKKLEGPDRPAT